MTRRPPRRGDRYRVAVCTTSDWGTASDVEFVVEAVTRLGCGCYRIETTRPGPADGLLGGRMHNLADRCPFHAANHAGYGDEPARVETLCARCGDEAAEDGGVCLPCAAVERAVGGRR